MSNYDIHKIMNIFIETKIKGEHVKNGLDTNELISKAKSSDNFYKFKKNIFFFFYKTKLDNKDAILMMYLIKPEGDKNTSGVYSNDLNELISFLESTFFPLDYTKFTRETINDENVGILKVVKTINKSEDLL